MSVPAVARAVQAAAPVPPDEEIAQSASSLWDTTLDAVPRVAVALAVVAAGWLVARLLRWVLLRVFGRKRTPSFSQVMSKVLSWLFLGVVVLLAVAVTFPSVKPVDVLAGLGFFSVAVGFAFQDILENTLAGVLLLFRQPFRSGDQIKVFDLAGTVKEINIRETQITTFDGELAIVPNRDVYKNVIVVSTYHPQRRLRFDVGIAYENDAGDATRIIHDTLLDVPGVAHEPAPHALVDELAVSTVNIAVRFWTGSRQADTLGVMDAAIRHVKDALERHGIEMPADIVALQATPSLTAALHNRGDITPGGQVRDD